MRLIDADTLVKDLSYLYTKNHIPVDMRAKEILTTIMEQPTAYDIGNVVEELKKMKGLACDGKSCSECEYTSYCLEGEQPEKVAIDKAIEIVKHGGVADDVCEWKQTSTAKYKTGCGYKVEEYFDTKACYCKQCGKRIKVVE